jgi:flagellin
MALTVNSLMAGLSASRYLGAAQRAQSTAMQRLSSGIRINSAKDDAAGLSMASKMTSHLNGVSQAVRNANDGVSMLQTADGALAAINENLQRMRELSVQAANGSNNESDRKAINAEFQQQLAEVQRLANTSSFNGIKLLDGSFRSTRLQVAPTAAEAIYIDGIPSMDTSQLGSTGDTFTTTVTGAEVTGPLGTGDLILNNTTISRSQAGFAAGQSSDSAYAIANAINAAASGVTATSRTRLVATGGLSPGSIADGSFSINGVSIGAIAGGADASSQGASVAAAIQSASSQTGVTADADSVTGAITLIAQDGRNINISLSGVAANASVAASNLAAVLSQTGFTSNMVGSQAVAAVAGQKSFQTGSINAASVGKSFVVNGVNFTIANSSGASSVSSATHVTLAIDITGQSNSSAAGVASALTAAINLAQADPLTAGALSGFSVNNSSPGVVVLSDLVAGVSNTFISTNVPTATGATNIVGSAPVAATTMSNHGSVVLSSSNRNGISVSGTSAGNAGLSTGVINASPLTVVIGINTADTLSAVNAQNAILSMDSALNQVDAARGKLGAHQNQLLSQISHLATDFTNSSEARSRIQDADFAVETAAWIRAGILSSASMAMVAQANTTPQMALTLLRGL